MIETVRGWFRTGCGVVEARTVTGARRALVVANDDYRDPGLRALRSPGQDAAALTEVLGDPAIGQFDVTVVRNAEVQELREQLDSFFSGAGRTDELLVHFSCHGLKDDANDLYLAATDTRASMLASTGLPADFVARRMRASRARSIALFLDCCYGGAFERGMLARAGSDVPVLDSFGQNELAEGAGRVVITASSAVEYAFESGDLTDAGQVEPSVFTSAIVQGISTGDADSDGTGLISVHELFAYAERHVRRVSPQQTPHMWSFGTRGDIVVARSPLRRVVPSTLPVAVQTALAGDRISRLGAVHVLSELLDEADPPTALAAVQALQYLVDDDSRSLSEAATTTLRRVRLTATPAVVEVAAGTPTSVEIVLGGSVLAIAARVETSPDWIKIRQIGDRLTLTIDTPTAADSYIEVAGPTGTTDIHVTATAPAAPAPTPAQKPPKQGTPQPESSPSAKASFAPAGSPPQARPRPESSQQPPSASAQQLPPASAQGPRPVKQPALWSKAPRQKVSPNPAAGKQAQPATAEYKPASPIKPTSKNSASFVLWISAAVVQILAPFLLGGGGYLAVLLVLGTCALLVASGVLSRRQNPKDLVTGIAGTALTLFFAIGVFSASVSSTDGPEAGAYAFVISAILAVIALIQTIRRHLRKRSAPTATQ